MFSSCSPLVQTFRQQETADLYSELKLEEEKSNKQHKIWILRIKKIRQKLTLILFSQENFTALCLQFCQYSVPYIDASIKIPPRETIFTIQHRREKKVFVCTMYMRRNLCAFKENNMKIFFSVCFVDISVASLLYWLHSVRATKNVQIYLV